MYETEEYGNPLPTRLFEECAEANLNGIHPDKHWQPDPVCALDGRTSTNFEHNDIDNPEENYRKHELVPSGEFHRKNTCPGYHLDPETSYTDVKEVCSCMCHWGAYYVNLYRLDQGYGGPEEGGWYYEAGELLGSFPFETLEAAELFKEQIAPQYPEGNNRYSTMPQDQDYAIYIEKNFGADFPQHTPRYE